MDFIVDKISKNGNQYYIHTKLMLGIYLRSDGSVGYDMIDKTGKLSYFRRKCDAERMLNAYNEGRKSVGII